MAFVRRWLPFMIVLPLLALSARADVVDVRDGGWARDARTELVHREQGDLRIVFSLPETGTGPFVVSAADVNSIEFRSGPDEGRIGDLVMGHGGEYPDVLVLRAVRLPQGLHFDIVSRRNAAARTLRVAEREIREIVFAEDSSAHASPRPWRGMADAMEDPGGRSLQESSVAREESDRPSLLDRMRALEDEEDAIARARSGAGSLPSDDSFGDGGAFEGFEDDLLTTPSPIGFVIGTICGLVFWFVWANLFIWPVCFFMGETDIHWQTKLKTAGFMALFATFILFFNWLPFIGLWVTLIGWPVGTRYVIEWNLPVREASIWLIMAGFFSIPLLLLLLWLALIIGIIAAL